VIERFQSPVPQHLRWEGALAVGFLDTSGRAPGLRRAAATRSERGILEPVIRSEGQEMESSTKACGLPGEDTTLQTEE